MAKPRLVIPFSLHFSVRYVLRSGLLRRLREFANPVVMLGWKDAELESELRDEGAEVHPLMEAHWGRSYQRWRSYVNLWHVKRLGSPSAGVWERRADLSRTLTQRWRRRARRKIFEAGFAVPNSITWLLNRERKLFWADTNARQVLGQAESLEADAALSLTPFLPGEEAILRAFATKGIPMCASILSFDNITTRGWIPIDFDRYLVWNSYNARELMKVYSAATRENIDIVGSPQFDFYRDPTYVWEETVWRRRMKLPAKGSVILLGGGFYTCAPHEPQFLLQLDQAVERKELPEDTVILFRNHPLDPIERWRPVLSQTKHTVHDDPTPEGRISGRTNIRRADIEKLASCLYHSKVHVNVASTMAVDGAIFDRPQVGPAYDDTPGQKWDRSSKELYQQEHYLPITNSGGLNIVYSRTELIRAVREGLENPERLASGRRRLLQEICTFDDGRATERTARSVHSFIERAVGERQERIEYTA